MTEAEERAAVVAEAKTWLRTPYHHAARVKGAGVDCAMLLAEVYASAGKIEPVTDVAYYPPDWHIHRDEERYLAHITSRARELTAGERPGAGDVIAVKYGRTYSHGAIVVDWPLVIHAYVATNVSYADFLRDGIFRERNGDLRQYRAFSPWGSP